MRARGGKEFDWDDRKEGERTEVWLRGLSEAATTTSIVVIGKPKILFQNVMTSRRGREGSIAERTTGLERLEVRLRIPTFARNSHLHRRQKSPLVDSEVALSFWRCHGVSSESDFNKYTSR